MSRQGIAEDFFSPSHNLPKLVFVSFPSTVWNKKINLGLLSISLASQKLKGFVSLSLWTPHTYRIRLPWSPRPIWLPSLSLVDPNKFWPGFTFPWLGSSNFIGVRFTRPLNTNTHNIIGFISLGLLDQTDSPSLSLVDPNKFWPGYTFPQPDSSNFIGVRFTQPLDTNIHKGFVSLGLLDQADSHHSALWTQTHFYLGSLSLSLVSQIWLAFDSLSLWTPTYA